VPNFKALRYLTLPYCAKAAKEGATAPDSGLRAELREDGHWIESAAKLRIHQATAKPFRSARDPPMRGVASGEGERGAGQPHRSLRDVNGISLENAPEVLRSY
jgi:hypothetical protein